MPQPRSSAALILHPSDAHWQPDNTDAFVEMLHSLAFIDNAIPGKDNAYYAGDKFLDDIAFMGCAPSIQFAPTDGREKFCYIHVINTAKPVLLFSTVQARAPGCPACGKTDKNWQQNVSDEKTALCCPHCHGSADYARWQWKKTAGYGRFFIEVTDIFPREAIPQTAFMAQLAQATGTDWQYFYYCRR